MQKVFIYSFLLLFGMAIAQGVDLEPARFWLVPVTMTCLAYIMIEVGLEFVFDRSRLKSYLQDSFVAATAAALPWILCSIYLYLIFGGDIKDAFLIGCFAAPTSAGVLFAMLSAAGLAETWLFRKARVLAIFDDLDTILLLIPLQMMYAGFHPQVFLLIFIIVALLWAAYRYLHHFHWPTSAPWLILYSISISLFCTTFEMLLHVHLAVLLPAFCLGCILYYSHDEVSQEQRWMPLDLGIKGLFMLLVGMSIPQVSVESISYTALFLHVIVLTLLSNLGKMVPSFFYQDEASLRERLALSVAMFPRGEVGAGVLLIAISYGLKGDAISVSGLSLALNLLLTSAFIAIVFKLIKNQTTSQTAS